MNGEDLSVEILMHPVLASKTITFRNQWVKL